MASGAALPRRTSAAAPDLLQFPADYGAHTASRTEWWYVTGHLRADARMWGFQVTFFRSRTGVNGAHGEPAAGGASRADTSRPDASRPNASRFAATELVFAHAAVTDLAGQRLRHDQRVARSGFGIAQASSADTDVVLRDWRLQRRAGAPQGTYRAVVASDSAGFALDARCTPTQPLMLQGAAGLSRKGPLAPQTSRYYSEPHLAVQATLTLDGKPVAVQGSAWLDHEWSDAYLDPQAVGWDWIGMNLLDGSALMAFRMRRADASTLYAGGGFRRAGGTVRSYAPAEVQFTPGRVWESPGTRARYPVEWRVATPDGRFTVRALLDNQELDSRTSTGAIYWEGLSELLDEAGARIGLGYLELTGYAGALRM